MRFPPRECIRLRQNGMLDRDYLDFIHQFLTPDRLERFAEVLENRTRAVTVVLESVYHSHNASACLRNCDAFGVQDVHVVESPFGTEKHRTIDVGTRQWLTVHEYRREDYDNPTEACLRGLKARGYRIVATAISDDGVLAEELVLTPRTALLFGGEKDGVSSTALDLADDVVTIPMYGFVQSFNVSVATALCLKTVVERVHREIPDWGIPEDERQAILDGWMDAAVRHQLPRVVEQYWRERREAERGAAVSKEEQ